MHTLLNCFVTRKSRHSCQSKLILLVKFVCLSTEIFFFSFQIGSRVGGDYPGGWGLARCCAWVGIGMCWCVLDGSVSVCRSAHLTCLGGHFLCVLACIGSFCTAGIGIAVYGMGIAVCFVSVRWFLLMLDHVSYIL